MEGGGRRVERVNQQSITQWDSLCTRPSAHCIGHIIYTAPEMALETPTQPQPCHVLPPCALSPSAPVPQCPSAPVPSHCAAPCAPPPSPPHVSWHRGSSALALQVCGAHRPRQTQRTAQRCRGHSLRGRRRPADPIAHRQTLDPSRALGSAFVSVLGEKRPGPPGLSTSTAAESDVCRGPKGCGGLGGGASSGKKKGGSSGALNIVRVER